MDNKIICAVCAWKTMDLNSVWSWDENEWMVTFVKNVFLLYNEILLLLVALLLLLVCVDFYFIHIIAFNINTCLASIVPLWCSLRSVCSCFFLRINLFNSFRRVFTRPSCTNVQIHIISHIQLFYYIAINRALSMIVSLTTFFCMNSG